MTLDDYLAEIDAWKLSESDAIRPLSATERVARDREARAWLEQQIGRRLESATWTEAVATAERRSLD